MAYGPKKDLTLTFSIKLPESRLMEVEVHELGFHRLFSAVIPLAQGLQSILNTQIGWICCVVNRGSKD